MRVVQRDGMIVVVRTPLIQSSVVKHLLRGERTSAMQPTPCTHFLLAEWSVT